MRRLLLALLLAAAALVAPSLPHARACSCPAASWPDASELLPQADAAFVGALMSRDEDPPPVNGLYSSGTMVRHHYRVEQVVKGDIPSAAVDVWGTTDGASCGLGTPVGQRIGLLLHRDGDRWVSGLCSIADADALVQVALAPPPSSGAVVPAVLAGSADARSPDRTPVLAAAASLLGAVTATRLVRRRRRMPKPTVL